MSSNAQSQSSAPLKVHVTNTTATSDFCYTFVMGGIDLDRPSYVGYLFNIMIAARRLRELGSQNDMILFAQLVSNDKYSTLPNIYEHILAEFRVQIEYLPPPTKEASFYSVQMDKFRILSLTN
jgi:hypothetical protein